MEREPGTLTLGRHDVLHIAVKAGHYQIAHRDVRNLLFYGRVVPLIQVGPAADDKTADIPIVIEGHAAVNSGGKAVTIHTRKGSYIIPLVSFRRVARGEAVSAPLFPLIPDYTGGPA
ncbi:MAG: hypothetical protein APR53_04940 [Methanoculleus sp. SDB]|nr:MAG: hypothetical protein APR53_04940 [Methanoculleus sp. SDB]